MRLKNAKGSLSLLLAPVILIGLIAVLVWQRQNIADWITLHTYAPPPAISQLAAQDSMTPLGKRLFYLNQPLLTSDRTTFSKNCPPTKSEPTIILGCYHPVMNGIYLFAVSDPQLSGVEQVTAAHEMLHGAYDRLSSSQRKYIDDLLTNYYKSVTDTRIRQEIDTYAKTEPGQVLNEMHSVFGTELANLPPALNDYYAKYFTNRSVIVAEAVSYQAVFISKEAQVTSDDQQLTAWKAQIDANESSLKSMLSQINQAQANLNNLKTSNPSGYNAQVPGYNQLVDAYNSLIAQTKSLIDQYNQLVDQRNAVALQTLQLQQDLGGPPAELNN